MRRACCEAPDRDDQRASGAGVFACCHIEVALEQRARQAVTEQCRSLVRGTCRHRGSCWEADSWRVTCFVRRALLFVWQHYCWLSDNWRIPVLVAM